MAAAGALGMMAVTLLGLSAGLFFAFSVAVMPGLRAVDDRSFTATMNAINRAILNPLFALVFVGAPVVTVLASVLAFIASDSAAWWLAAAAAIYPLGILVVTGAVSVPLNEALERDGNRAAFESRWVRFNSVRTVAGIISFAAALVGVAS